MDYTVADRDLSGGNNLGRTMDLQSGCEKPHGGPLQGGLPSMGWGERAAFCWHPRRSRLSTELLNKLTQQILAQEITRLRKVPEYAHLCRFREPWPQEMAAFTSGLGK